MRSHRKTLRVGASAACGAALLWGLWHYGATETWELYRLFLWLLAPTLVVAWTLPLELWRGPRGSALILVGCFLLAQVALRPTLEGRGYVLAALGWLGLFLSLGLASRGRSGVRQIVLFLVVAGAWESLYGLVQVLSNDGSGGGDHQIYGATGTLFNRNHFAGLLNMTLPLALGVLAAGHRDRRAHRSASSETRAYTWVMGLSCSLMGLAILLSLSRGGVLTLVSTLVLMTSMLLVSRRRSSDRGFPARVALWILIAALGLGLVVGLDGLTSRFADFSAGRDGRRMLYTDSLRMISDHPLFGVGPGMYRWRFRPYQTFDPERRYDHAHNDYLETAADWGIPAAFLFWGFVGWRLYRACRQFYAPHGRTREARRSSWRQGLALGCSGSIFSIAVHSLVDFNLQIPTHLTIFGAILGLAWSLEWSRETRESAGASNVVRFRP